MYCIFANCGLGGMVLVILVPVVIFSIVGICLYHKVLK